MRERIAELEKALADTAALKEGRPETNKHDAALAQPCPAPQSTPPHMITLTNEHGSIQAPCELAIQNLAKERDALKAKMAPQSSLTREQAEKMAGTAHGHDFEYGYCLTCSRIADVLMSVAGSEDTRLNALIDIMDITKDYLDTEEHKSVQACRGLVERMQRIARAAIESEPCK